MVHVLTIYGCTDSLACNYNSSAGCDDGSCLTVYGCMDSTAFNYNANATCDDGGCIPFIYGCTDSTAYNYNISVNTDDGSCIPFIYGCTDSLAFNYNISANTDDGSCIPTVYGCTDPTATNYNSTANTDDGTCTNCYAIADLVSDTLNICDTTIISTQFLSNATYTWTHSNTLLAPSIGSYIEGGVVFYINENEGYGLVSDIQDLATGNQGGMSPSGSSTGWGCDNSAVGANSDWDGKQNTINALNCSAAAMCYNYSNQGYSDWFLPAKQQLYQMYLKKDVINATAIANGGTLFGDYNPGNDCGYWSSTENGTNYAWNQHFHNNFANQPLSLPKSWLIYGVRYQYVLLIYLLILTL